MSRESNRRRESEATTNKIRYHDERLTAVGGNIACHRHGRRWSAVADLQGHVHIAITLPTTNHLIISGKNFDDLRIKFAGLAEIRDGDPRVAVRLEGHSDRL